MVLAELLAAHYRFRGNAVCSDCRKRIEYWESKGGTRTVFEEMPSGSSPVVVHSCRMHRRPNIEPLQRRAALR